MGGVPNQQSQTVNTKDFFMRTKITFSFLILLLLLLSILLSTSQSVTLTKNAQIDPEFIAQLRKDFEPARVMNRQMNFKGTVYFFKNYDINNVINQFKKLDKDIREVGSLLNKIQINFSDNVIVDNFPPIPSWCRLSIADLDKQRQLINSAIKNTESEWIVHLAEKKENLKKDIDVYKKKISADTKMREITEYLQPTTSTFRKLEIRIKKYQEKIEDIQIAAIDAFNKSIVNKEIPIPKLHDNSSMFNKYNVYPPNEVWDKISCEAMAGAEEIAIYNKPGNGSCFIVAIPDVRLKNLNAIQEYKKLFKQYLPLKLRLGNKSYRYKNGDKSLFSELKHAETKLGEAHIIAANKFDNFSEIYSQISDIKYKINKKKEEIEKLDTDPWEKKHFIHSFMSKNIENLVS